MTTPGNIAAPIAEPIAVPLRLYEFFEVEAEDCVARMSHVLDAVRSDLEPDTANFLAAARAVRGAASMIRLAELALLAERIERIGRALHTGAMQWNPGLVEALTGAVNTIGDVVPRARRWSADEDKKARAGAGELVPLALEDAPKRDRDLVMPVAELFHDDPGPHILYVAVTPQTQFEQQLHEFAHPTAAESALRNEQTPPSPRRTITDVASVFATPPAGSATAPSPPRPAQKPPSPWRTTPAPRGRELRNLLQESVTRLTGELEAFPDAATDTSAPDELVPIDSLLYRGTAALARAKQLGNSVRAAITPATPEVMAELVDLIELARP